MLPQTSHRTERVLSRNIAHTRPRRQSPLQPRDKRTHFDLRYSLPRYDEAMSQPHDNLKERERELAAWLVSVAREKKRLYRWSTDDTIDHSSIDRATWYRWKKISIPGNMPKAQTLNEFCESLGLDPAIPYGILGWGQPANRPAAVDPSPESDIDRRIRLLRIAIDRPGIKREEQRVLETHLVRLLAAKQASDDALTAADDALKRHKAG